MTLEEIDALKQRVKDLEKSQETRLGIIMKLQGQVETSMRQAKDFEALGVMALNQRDDSEKKVKFLTGVLKEKNERQN